MPSPLPSPEIITIAKLCAPPPINKMDFNVVLMEV